MPVFQSKLIVMTLGVVTLLWPSPADSPAHRPVRADAPAVRIEHQLIRATPPARVRPRVPVVSAVNRLASRTVEAPRSQSFVARASRVLTGDGRYRPEPFPRLGR